MATISAELVSGGEKRDASGRMLIGTARREAVLGAYDRSELTQREFAEREGVKYNTLVSWLDQRRRQQRGTAKPNGSVRFEELRMPTTSAMGLEVCLPGGVIVRGHDAAQVAALVRVLR
jgi:hypothetical protein